jgi:hypothetical protein
MPIVAEETFAPILYLLPADDLDRAIADQNGVKQGLSSSIFTRSMQVAEQFLSAWGSDCGHREREHRHVRRRDRRRVRRRERDWWRQGVRFGLVAGRTCADRRAR